MEKIGSMQMIVQANGDYTVRNELHEGKTHLVVPVVMMVEGVHSGSAGPLFHPAAELGRFPVAWDGRPVVVHHPQNAEGQNISANSPEVLDKEIVGRVFNTHMDENKLRAEVWIDEDRLRGVSAETLTAIKQGAALEVSIGVFTDEENAVGVHNGEHYESIARNHRPDHLALLPDEIGACSWEDGCGIRNNKQKGGAEMPENKVDLIQTAKSLNKDGFTIVPLITDNEQGYRELISGIQTKLDAMDDGTKYHYLMEVYEDSFVYEVRRREGGSPKLYKRGYTVGDDQSVDLAEEPTEVKRNVEYVTLNNNSSGFTRAKSNVKTKEVHIMSETKKPCCEDAVDALIANEHTTYTSEDKEWLLELEEGRVAKLVANAAKVKSDPKPEPVKEPVTQSKTEEPEKPKSADEFIATMPSELQDQFRSGLKLHKEQKDNMVKTILANTVEGVWTEEILVNKDFDELTRIQKTIPEVADYSLSAAGGNVSDGAPKEVLLPAGMGVKNESK